MALPFLLFAVAVTALLGNGITQAMVVTGVLVSPLFYRVSRAATLAVARSHYVEAAIIAGASVGWIVRRHVWVKVLPPIAVALAQTLGVGFVIVSSLTFLGIGVQPPQPTWGGLLATSLAYLSYQPWAPLAPALLIMATVWASNLLADAIRDVSGEAGQSLVDERRAAANRIDSSAIGRPGGGTHDPPVRASVLERSETTTGETPPTPPAAVGGTRTLVARRAHHQPGGPARRSSTG